MQIILIEDDPVFRSGLRVWLNQLRDIQVQAEFDTGATALAWLENHAASPPTSNADQTVPVVSSSIDLIILSATLEQGQPGEASALDLCQHLKTQYPTLPILMLSAAKEPVLAAAARQAGANGYCLKTASVPLLEAVIRQVAAGESRWLVAAAPRSDASQSNAPSAMAPLANGFARLRYRMRRSGVQQINQAIGEVTDQLRTLDLSLLDQAVLAGRRRELIAARWLVTRLLATPTLPDDSLPTPTFPPLSTLSTLAMAGGTRQLPQSSSSGLVPAEVTPLRPTPVENVPSLVFDSVLTKLHSGVLNLTEQPLELDILKEDKRRELLYLTLRKFEAELSELRYSAVAADQLLEKRSSILLDLWQAVLIDFLGRYYTVVINGFEVEVVTTLLQDAAVVQSQRLDKIPFVPELLAHLLFQTPLVVNGRPCAPGNPDALNRAEVLLENVMIQIANGVMQALLNHFADVEAIKQTYYDRRLLSTREIERFRNDLSWWFRLDRLIKEPKAMFESEYRLFILQGRGIKPVSIYAPRTQDLEQLTGIRRAVTIALEARDAVSPRLRSALSVVGSSVVYVLTEVLGRGIGLIGRGILKGIGGGWQDGKFDRQDGRRD